MKNVYCKLLYVAVAVIFISAFSACRKDSPFKDGKRIYSSKADEIKVFPGEKRIKITFTITDPAITRAVIFWNNRENSKEIQINGAAEYSSILDNMAEGDYDFEVITYDASGNTSTPISIIGKVYGDEYNQNLVNTPIKDIIYTNGTAFIYWGDIRRGTVLTEVNYTDNENTEQQINVPLTETVTRLENFKPGTLDATFRYRTLYKPDTAAIDTFYSEYQTATVITGSLKALANAKNILFGSLISYGTGTTHGVIFDGSPNGIYTAICENEFNLGQAAWGPGRWKKDEPSDFNDVNAVINWSRPRYDKIFTHLITGPNNYMPSWFTTGTFTPTEMDDLLKGLVYEIMESNDNKSKVDVWNVANELFNENGTYRTMKWNDMGWEDDASGLTGSDQVNIKHPAFVGKALQYCRDKTDALLELRDFGIENDDPESSYYYKYKAFYQLIKHLKAKNYPVDAVGIQSHMIIGKGVAVGTSANMNADVQAESYEHFKNAIKKYKEAGLKVYLTELDIVSSKINSQLQPWNNQLAEQQRKDYYNVVKAAIEGGVDAISLWGVRDDNDPGWRVGQNPLLFLPDYTKKPAYYGVQKALYEAQK